VPQGAYYVLADSTGLPGDNGKERSMYLLHEAGVACVPGETFFKGEAGRDLVRFCFAKEDDVIEEASRRLASLSLRPAASQ
jgi:aminotransferase